jgi:cutinase
MTSTKLRILGYVLAPTAVLALAPTVAPTAVAAPCPDVEVVFARGTTEAPGVGGTGAAFVEALRSQLGPRSLGVYPVNYPASNDFDTSTPAGARDAADHIRETAANCPNTRMVLGGYSQGAAVIDMATAELPPEVVDHVAAVADFGGPRSTFADSLSAGPSPVIAPAYAGKLIDLCVPNDPICFQGGWDMGAHTAYVQNGLVNQAASFAAGRI